MRALLTADHGMVNIDPPLLRDLADSPALAQDVRLIAGETRAVHVHAEPGRARGVEERWRAELGEGAWILNRAQMGALIGQGPGADAVGDLLVLARGRGGVVDSRVQSAAMIAMPGVHGSLSSEEMRIPLVRLA